MRDSEKELRLQKRIQELEHELDLSKIKYSILADCTDCGLWEYDIETKCLNQSKKLHGIWEHNNLDIPNYRDTVLGWGIIHPEDVDVFKAYCNSMDNGVPNFQYDLRAVTDDATFTWLRYTGSTYYDEYGKPIKVVGKTIDVTKEKKEKEDLERKANLDSLTKLNNKVHTRALIEEYLNRYDGENIMHGFYLIDIDNFKQVNDTWGHLCGDNLLVQFANRILGAFTTNDIVGRIGGDEFLVFVPNIKSYAEGRRIAQKIITNGSKIYLENHQTITLSVGMSVFPRDAQSYDALFRSADLALYRVKQKGKNGFCAYDKKCKYKMRNSNGERPEAMNEIIFKNMEDVETKLFDYSFETISTADDIGEAIYNIMMEVGIYYDLFRVSIVEYANKKAKVTKLWTKEENINTPKQRIEGYFTNSWRNVEERFYSAKFYVSNKLNEKDKENLQGEEIERRQFVQYPILDGEELLGVITFEKLLDENTESEEEISSREGCWTPSQISTLSCISKMISSYLLKLNTKTEVADELLYTGYALDSQKLTFYVIDSDSYELRYVSRYANELFPSIAVGKKCYEAVMNQKQPCSNCPIAGLAADKQHFATELYSEEFDTWFTVSVSVVNKENRNRQYLLCWTDVTAFLERVRSTDQLTGTLSYDKFYAEAIKKLSNTERSYSMLYFGIKDFARINDEFGFEIGDMVIKLLANRFIDVLSEQELICRIKGDDFIIMVESKDLYHLKERTYLMCRTTEIFLRTIYPAMNMYCICGMYEVTAEDYSLSAILDKANKARKKAYQMFNGDHTFFIYTKEYERQEMEEIQLERDIIEALKTGQFQVYIQPKVSLDTKKIGGGEALVRWVKPDGSVVPPGRFIPLAEKNGMVIEIDHEVYNVLFKQMREWLDEGKTVPVISINVSRLHLLDDEFPAFFESLVDSYGLPHKLIEVEVTESVFFDKVDRMISMISKIREMGFQISMDDFGTGYSTLNIMSNLPLDIIKIDGKFFMNTPLDERNRTIISAIVNLTKSLDFSIVCEGIETLEQVKYITNENCDFAQGYYFYKPMPMQEFGKLI
ncbi:bifunctional diguanylate cyclase/phosphodiesterase [[Clostridium] polysaccharolyticum]|uniref:Diguanylate cyclase (GGDEF) domain-containing protein n=1 Tax=[Clostridium] polysaccharolyticum TaxID=29364 RepID=A0A1I0B6H9_9FIRM|nr:bifunctional diguanylate cyclase/phosphodiesterase [[Clostridium] polysaccharolyticum]SET01640.1 diguanylate cyclase (GGDEF) domain-containing protein [[Clostridium] polysaccharolyticum]